MRAILVVNQVKVFIPMNREEFYIRDASLVDIVAITDIYNESILTDVATFDTEPKSIEDRVNWFNAHDEKHPIIVACVEDKVVGWASLSIWSDRPAYNGTAEVSVYVDAKYRNMGMGGQLIEELVYQANSNGLHYLLSRITMGNETSIRLHKRYGFETIGVMHEVGHKFGIYLDVTLMEKVLEN